MDQSIISLAYKYNGWGIALYILIVTLVSGVLSAIIGVEREIKGQAAGLRTHVLLSIGCTLIMTISIFGIGFASGQIDFSQGYIDASKLSYDTSRIGAGITAGLTTAATLWVSAGIGMACGSGLVLEAIIVAAVTMILLTGLLHIEKAIGRRSPQIKLTVAKNTVVIKAIRMEAEANGLIIKNIVTHQTSLKNGEEAVVVTVLFALQSSQPVLEELCESLSNRDGVLSVERVHFKNPIGE